MPRALSPLRVLFTVDTEFWPADPGFQSRLTRDLLHPEREFRRDILGEVQGGDFGVPYQIRTLREHRLTGSYFVESLAASVVGPETLERTVAMLVKEDHEVQLHLHTEWLAVEPNEILPGHAGQHIRQFTFEAQCSLLARARDNLRAAGAPSVTAFRAGNFGASWDTVRAVGAVGLTHDTSHNAAWLGRSCNMPTAASLLQPERRGEVWEVPVSWFEDWPGHVRPAQVTACSSSEMIHALRAARSAGWRTFVIVFHSHELLNARRDGPNPVVIRRFHDLCRFLGENRDSFPTATFSSLREDDLALERAVAPIRSAPWRTALRMGEQLAQRLGA
jgi:hypothetical protein